MSEDENTSSEIPTYEVDEETRSIIAVACDLILQLADAQVDDQSATNLQVIADSIADRFGINSMEVIEEKHGDEIIYKPRGGLFNDDEEE
tara:strand:+ start:1587 stop:1856 length:270 start_codon:yes stop_codon:yes gene_type:complete